MNKQEYWRKLLEVNPKFNNETITIKTSKLKAIIFQAFDKATYNYKHKEKEKPKTKTGIKEFDDIFFK